MKKIILLYFLLSIVNQLFAQELGLRISSTFNNKIEKNLPIGSGFFIKVNTESEKFSFLVFADFLSSKNFEYENMNTITKYKNNSFGFAPVMKKLLNRHLILGIGPTVSLSFMKMESEKYFNPSLNLYSKCNQEDFGLGVLGIVEYAGLWNSRFNAIAFVNPTYFTLIESNEKATKYNNAWSIENSFGTNINIGVSYNLP